MAIRGWLNILNNVGIRASKETRIQRSKILCFQSLSEGQPELISPSVPLVVCVAKLAVHAVLGELEVVVGLFCILAISERQITGTCSIPLIV